MFTTSCLLVIQVHFFSSLGLDFCTNAACQWMIDDYKLDLTPFQLMGLNLSGQDNNKNDYYFSPCNNLIPNNDNDITQFQYMAVQVNNQQNQEINFLVSYNQSVNPTIKLDENSEAVWHFQYNDNFAVEYICDYDAPVTTLLKIVQVLEVYPYSYLMRISSPYICNNLTISDEFNKNQCIWKDETDFVLDLRPLYGQQLCFKKIPNCSYPLYVCQNSEWQTGSTTRGGCATTGCCAMYGYNHRETYGIFDPSIEPIFNKTSVTWTFEYKDTPNGTTSVIWKCNRDIDPYSVQNSGPTKITISTKYACPAQCVFVDKHNSENVLDLTSLSGELIRAISDDVTYSFEYTVCHNDVMCKDKNIYVMAMRWDISRTECNPYLAIWDGFEGYDISYDADLNQWQFVYYNGEPCKDRKNNPEFNIYWKCNQTVTNWDVTKIETIDECQYAMYIESAFAC